MSSVPRFISLRLPAFSNRHTWVQIVVATSGDPMAVPPMLFCMCLCFNNMIHINASQPPTGTPSAAAVFRRADEARTKAGQRHRSRQRPWRRHRRLGRWQWRRQRRIEPRRGPSSIRSRAPVGRCRGTGPERGMPRHRPQRQATGTERSSDEARRAEDGAWWRRVAHTKTKVGRGRHGHGRAEDPTRQTRKPQCR